MNCRVFSHLLLLQCFFLSFFPSLGDSILLKDTNKNATKLTRWLLIFPLVRQTFSPLCFCLSPKFFFCFFFLDIIIFFALSISNEAEFVSFMKQLEMYWLNWAFHTVWTVYRFNELPLHGGSLNFHWKHFQNKQFFESLISEAMNRSWGFLRRVMHLRLWDIYENDPFIYRPFPFIFTLISDQIWLDRSFFDVSCWFCRNEAPVSQNHFTNSIRYYFNRQPHTVQLVYVPCM